jgi:hypothetical protein
MRFSTAVNVLLLGVATVVSALPIAQSTSSLELESRDDYDELDMFERDFDEPTLYRRTEYHVALHQSGMGTEKEHWQMQFHPQSTHASATWHAVHAVSGGAGAGGVLETEHRQMGGKDKGYDASRQTGTGRNHMVLGSFKTAGDAKKAAESLKGIKCTSSFPGQNCVDWTKHAVDKLHADGHISEAKKNEFTAHYNKHEATVRKTTGTAANKKAAGHK